MSVPAVPASAASIAFSSYGEPEELRLVDAPVPHPGHGQVLLRVRAAGVNPVDWKIRGGALTDFLPVDLPHVPGLEAAGVVMSIGAGVSSWSVGDEVFGPAVGAYAEYALADADRLAAKPADLDWERAAGLHMVAETAYRALEFLEVAVGDTVLIHGAAGGVGGLATQFAIAAGAHVVGTASEANHAYLRTLGAVPVEYGEGLFDRVREVVSGGVDAVLDTAGGGVLAGSVELLGGPERVVSIVDPAEAGPLGVRFTGGDPAEDRTAPALARAVALHAAGTLCLPIRATFPLADAAAAHRLGERGHGRGKIILVP
ncbi:NADP-dependent oxidoreductase [Microtetraspora fusca]|uniref:NADP-dependent oxidoreductase n=1 Tax=Microtetraspora fusca TaxID=1997 RepID=A0ABW6VDQ9_MICFU|nr:NADP-dependent oxidoreductase [Microtetraspora fusca]